MSEDCIADDSTECDCVRCRAADVRWAVEQGWEDPGDRCVLGAECCNPHPFHTADECSFAEMHEAYEAELRANDPKGDR